MGLRLDGTETLEDIREGLRNIAATLAKTRSLAVRKALRKQQDDLLDAELRLKQRRPGDC